MLLQTEFWPLVFFNDLFEVRFLIINFFPHQILIYFVTKCVGLFGMNNLWFSYVFSLLHWDERGAKPEYNYHKKTEDPNIFPGSLASNTCEYFLNTKFAQKLLFCSFVMTSTLKNYDLFYNKWYYYIEFFNSMMLVKCVSL